MDDLAYDCSTITANALGPISLKYLFSGLGIPMLKLRRSRDPLIFNMGGEVPTPVRRHPIFMLKRLPGFTVLLHATVDLAQDCDNSIAYPLELPELCTKP